MNVIRRHKIFFSLLAVVILLLAGLVGYVYSTLSKLNRIARGGVPQTAVTQDVEDDSPDINDISVDDDVSQALMDADALIRMNLDDSKKWFSDEVMNVVLFGYDYGSKTYPYGRSDAMIVLSLNQAVRKVKVISLSRTAYAAIPGYPNTRLSHAHGYGGPSLGVQAIELNYKFRVNNYVSCSFDGFRQIIDALGGVPITLTESEAKVMRESFPGFSGAGSYTLNGEQALLYARTRKIDNDRTRTGRQRKIIMALVAKAKQMSLPQCVALLDRLLPMVTTDFTRSELLYQMANALQYLNWEFEQHLIPEKPYNLVLRDNFEVILMNWAYEVDYLHELMYEKVIPQYEEN